MMLLDEIRDASEEALSKIANDANRIAELDDHDLASVVLQMKTAVPIAEQALIALCGSVEAATHALASVKKYSQGKLVKLVKAAHVAMRTHRNPSVGQMAALVYDIQVGCDAVMGEQLRRHAVQTGALH